MPRITEATVAEHREKQRRNLLDAAHELLRESPTAPSMSAVGQRAGLSRSAVYQYFDSREDLLYALVADVFPRWTSRITTALAEAPTVADRILAYANANLELVDSGAHAVGSALAALAPGEQLDAQADRMHGMIQDPLTDTLAELGIEAPEQVGELINAVIHAGTRMLESGIGLDAVVRHVGQVLEPLVAAHR